MLRRAGICPDQGARGCVAGSTKATAQQSPPPPAPSRRVKAGWEDACGLAAKIQAWRAAHAVDGCLARPAHFAFFDAAFGHYLVALRPDVGAAVLLVQVGGAGVGGGGSSLGPGAASVASAPHWVPRAASPVLLWGLLRHPVLLVLVRPFLCAALLPATLQTNAPTPARLPGAPLPRPPPACPAAGRARAAGPQDEGRGHRGRGIHPPPGISV